MPIGVQLVGRRGNDARLLRTARWLVKTLQRGGRRRPAKERAAPRSANKGRRYDDRSDHRHHRHRHACGVSRLHGGWVKAIPLIIIVVVVVALLIYDFVQTLRAGESGA